jgi:hypothetical protein
MENEFGVILAEKGREPGVGTNGSLEDTRGACSSLPGCPAETNPYLLRIQKKSLEWKYFCTEPIGLE